MSCYVFGDFFTEKADSLSRERIQDILRKDEVNIFFDEQMNPVYDETLLMLKEYPSNKSNVRFCLTYADEVCNGDDLIEPFGMYTEEELFPDGVEGSRMRFKQLCLENLTPLNNAITGMLAVFEPENFRVFISSGFDGEFSVVSCTIEEMIGDICEKITKNGVDSHIYLIKP